MQSVAELLVTRSLVAVVPQLSLNDLPTYSQILQNFHPTTLLHAEMRLFVTSTKHNQYFRSPLPN